jgi:hypothetical protein
MAEVLSVKRKHGQVLKCKEQKIVLNVFSYVKTKFPEQSVRWVASKIAVVMADSRASIFKI